MVDLDFPIGHHSRTLLWIGPYFVETIDDDITTDEERQLQDSNIESEEEEHPNIRAKEYGLDDNIDDDEMDEARPRS